MNGIFAPLSRRGRCEVARLLGEASLDGPRCQRWLPWIYLLAFILAPLVAPWLHG
jgi:hypothetical protein